MVMVVESWEETETKTDYVRKKGSKYIVFHAIDLVKLNGPLLFQDNQYKGTVSNSIIHSICSNNFSITNLQ